MKKIYVLLSAACVAASATAVEKQSMASSDAPIKAQAMMNTASPEKASKVRAIAPSLRLKKSAKKASKAEQYCYFRPAEGIMALGSSINGYGYKGLGFASPYGYLEFVNYSTGVSVNEWVYADLNDFEIVDDAIEWNLKYSDAENLVVKSGVGEILAPQLYVTYASGEEDMCEINPSEFLCGGSSDYWVGQDPDGAPFGITFYQNSGLENPEGYSGSQTYKNSYQPGAKNYNENGVYVEKANKNNWQNMLNEEFEGQTVSNIAIENFTIIQSKTPSAYFMTKGWGWINVDASKATQLQSYIYPIDEDGYISDTPIALGYAAIAKGSNSHPVFEYLPLDENGDELEGEVFIDTAVAVTIEGFNGNSAIKSVTPVSGFCPFSYEAYSGGNYGVIKDANLLINFSCDVDGTPQSVYLYDRGLYYYDQRTKPNGEFYDDDTLSLLAYAEFSMDATFAWIKSVNDEESVSVPLEGGEFELDVNALYYNINALIEEGTYELTAPDWLAVAFGESDRTSGDTTMTVVADACEAPGRSGVITLEGLGAKFNLEVVQGESGAVNVVVADGDVQYFDLAGRRVANPDKGIYIKKAGNKAEKVVF